MMVLYDYTKKVAPSLRWKCHDSSKLTLTAKKKQHILWNEVMYDDGKVAQHILGMQNAVTWPLYGKLAFFWIITTLLMGEDDGMGTI